MLYYITLQILIKIVKGTSSAVKFVTKFESKKHNVNI